MKINSTYISLVAFLIIGASLPASQIMAASDQYMFRYCKSAAEKEYGVSQDNIRTLPVERTGNHYKVYGQSPKDGQNALFFTCTFDHNSNFTHLKKVSDSRNHSGNNHSGGQNKNLRHECKVAAAEEFGLRRKNITVQKPTNSQGMIEVWGQFPSNPSPTIFTCTFTKKHDLVGVEIIK